MGDAKAFARAASTLYWNYTDPNNPRRPPAETLDRIASSVMRRREERQNEAHRMR
jgi:hypothetical protein